MKHLPHWVNSFAPQYANSSTSGRPNLCVTRIWYNSLQVTVKKMITFQVKKKNWIERIKVYTYTSLAEM